MLFSLFSIFITILWIVIGTSKVKLHPFLVLLSASFLLAILLGIKPIEMIILIQKGFGNIIQNIGLLILFGTIIGIAETGIMLFAFNLIMNDISLFYVFGVNNLSVHAGIVFFSMLYAPVSMVTSIISSYISRKNEFEADKYSLDTTNNSEALISMLIGLSANNLSHLTPHPLKVFLSYSHPPVIDRIKAVTQRS